jgi:hypothetical protein
MRLAAFAGQPGIRSEPLCNLLGDCKFGVADWNLILRWRHPDILSFQPILKIHWRLELRQVCTALKPAILDRQVTPLSQQIVANSVSPLPKFSNGNASFESTGLSLFAVSDDVSSLHAIPSGVSVE